MHVKRSLKLLTKINGVFNHIVEEGDELSALESQLLKNYIIELYDAVCESDKQEDAPAKASTKENQPMAPKPAVSQREEVAPPKPVTSADQAKPTVEEPPMPQASRVIEQSGIPLSPAAKQSIEEATAETIAQPAVLEKKKEGPLDALYAAIDEKIDTGHLGQKLITDLKKSIGLNDKLRYANELFNGNQSKLLETLDLVNQEKDTDRVKAHLNELAENHHWTDPKKASTLNQFLHLIFSKK